jgi:hypothetical protein
MLYQKHPYPQNKLFDVKDLEMTQRAPEMIYKICCLLQLASEFVLLLSNQINTHCIQTRSDLSLAR